MHWLPNAISLTRLALLLPYAWYVFEPRAFGPAFWLAAVMIASDKLDGTLARKLHVESKLGEFLDSLSDTALVLLSWLFFFIKGNFGLLLLIMLLLPRPVSALGYWLKYRKTGTWDLTHLPSSRIGAVLNFAAILWVLGGLPYQTAMLWIMAGFNLLLSVTSIFTRLGRAQAIKTS